MYYIVIIIAHCGFDALACDRLVSPHKGCKNVEATAWPSRISHSHVGGNSFSQSRGRKTPALPFKPGKPVHQGRDESVRIRLRIINHVALQKDSH